MLLRRGWFPTPGRAAILLPGAGKLLHGSAFASSSSVDPRWTQVDKMFERSLVFTPRNVALKKTLSAVMSESEKHQLPQIHVAANQGKFLAILAQAMRAKRILEIGTLAGYSTIWLADAVSLMAADAQVLSLEIDASRATLARDNVARAGLQDKVTILQGSALDTLRELAQAPSNPFDMIFVDADKISNVDYFKWSLKLSRPGTLIVFDNVVRNGGILDEHSNDESIRGIQALFDVVSKEPRVEATALQTVGCKGWDGICVILVKTPG